MKMGEAERWLQQQLEPIYDASEKGAIAAWVFEKLTGTTRSQRAATQNEPLHAAQLHNLTTIAKRLLAHEPVQYVLGESYFRNLKLYVDKAVLIPRPETEELVQWIADDVAAMRNTNRKPSPTIARNSSLKILDVGTGSGCIALALKNEIMGAEVWGCDVSDAALTVARRNGAALDLRVDFQALDFLTESQWKTLPAFDIIVSNPPYIPELEAAQMSANVVAHEPHTALFVPDTEPLLFYKTLAQFGAQHLHGNGLLYVEIHQEQGAAVHQLFQNAMYQNVILRTDMQGKNRMVKAVWTGGEGS